MSSSSTSNFSIFKLLVRSVQFLIGLALTYALIVVLMSAVPIKQNTLFKVVIGNLSQTGGQGQTLRRFREIETADNIDLLFIGSSHCYRSFDPKVFSRLGLNTINLGSSSQTPLNSYYLLEKYYKKIKPKLVVFELYPMILQLNGLEGFYDLASNLVIDDNIFQMSRAVNHMHGYNSLAERYISSFLKPLASFDQSPIANEQYVTGGYLHAEIIYQDDFFGPTGDINIRENQLEYFKLIIDFVKENRGKLLVLIAPLPEERVQAIRNYDVVIRTIDDITADKDILFYDFNKTMKLNTRTDYRDHHHLNANGAKIFSYALLDSLLDVPELNRVLRIKPNYASEIYTGRGITFVSENKFEQAEKDLKKALNIDANNFKALINLGLVHLKKENFNKALDCFDRALIIDAKSFDAYYNKAVVYEKIGENKQAVKFYQNSLAYLPAQFASYKQGIIQKINSLK